MKLPKELFPLPALPSKTMFIRVLGLLGSSADDELQAPTPDAAELRETLLGVDVV